MEFLAAANVIKGLQKADLTMREKLASEGRLSNGYDADMEALHIHNALVLEKIIDEIGYPTAAKVGADGSEAAWLVIQHSVSKPRFMKKCLRLLQIEVYNGNGNPVHLAYLSDRIDVLEDRLQQYGTQFDWDENGEMKPCKYGEDMDLIDQRRAALGMYTLDEQTKIIIRQIADENQSPPSEFDKRKLEMDSWRKKVGWIS